jgi:Methyltransferase domain
MTARYLSLAFSQRSPEEIKFLNGLDGRSAFPLFWLDVVRPLLQTIAAKQLVEVGAYHGEHTRCLIEYCAAHGATLIVIDPVVGPELEAVCRGALGVRIVARKSHEALPDIGPVDAVLLNGDLNYHTVTGDLSAIAQAAQRHARSFPLVVTKSMSWPYARRDMYYAPDDIPAAHRHPYARSGMTPWASDLAPGLINSGFANALAEGGPRNGVRTAVEDFVRESTFPLRLLALPTNHGVGILYEAGSRTEEFLVRNLAPPPLLARLLEACELVRLNDILRRLEPRHAAMADGSVRSRAARAARSIGRRFLRVIER